MLKYAFKCSIFKTGSRGCAVGCVATSQPQHYWFDPEFCLWSVWSSLCSLSVHVVFSYFFISQNMPVVLVALIVPRNE